MQKPYKTPHEKANCRNCLYKRRLCVESKGVLCRQSGAFGILSGNHIYIVSLLAVGKLHRSRILFTDMLNLGGKLC